MILDAMQANQAEGVSMCDAHPDLEVFRLRLGKALSTTRIHRRAYSRGEIQEKENCIWSPIILD
jgi:hypothetical protein